MYEKEILKKHFIRNMLFKNKFRTGNDGYTTRV